MKLRFYLGLFFISFLQIVLAQEPVILGGVVSLSGDGDDLFIVSSNNDHEFPAFSSRKFDTESLELTQCIGNIGWRIEKVGLMNDSIFFISQHPFGPFRAYNFISDECDEPTNFQDFDTLIFATINWVVHHDILVGKPTYKSELYFFNTSGEFLSVKEIKGEFVNDHRNYFGVSSEENLLYIDIFEKFIHKIDTSGNIISSVEIPVDSASSINLRNGLFNILDENDGFNPIATQIDEEGNLLRSAELKNNCNDCVYEEVLITDEGYFLFGSLFQSEKKSEIGRIVIDRDPVVAKFDLDGNLISTKFYDDDENGKFKFGFHNSEGKLIIFGDFIDRNSPGFKGVSPLGGYLITDIELSGLKDLESRSTLFNNEFRFGPNPADNQFTIYPSKKESEYELNLFAVNGQLLKNIRFKGNKEVDVSQLEHGVYILQVVTSVSGKVYNGKVIVYH